MSGADTSASLIASARRLHATSSGLAEAAPSGVYSGGTGVPGKYFWKIVSYSPSAITWARPQFHASTSGWFVGANANAYLSTAPTDSTTFTSDIVCDDRVGRGSSLTTAVMLPA